MSNSLSDDSKAKDVQNNSKAGNKPSLTNDKRDDKDVHYPQIMKLTLK